MEQEKCNHYGNASCGKCNPNIKGAQGETGNKDIQQKKCIFCADKKQGQYDNAFKINKMWEEHQYHNGNKFTPEEAGKGETVNYCHSGPTISCGHCNSEITELVEKYGLICDCQCHSLPQPLQWEEAERDAFEKWKKGYDCFIPAENVNNYWLARISKIREEAYQEGFDAGGQTKGGTGRTMYEQGRLEERTRLIEKIEGKIRMIQAPDDSNNQMYNQALNEIISSLRE